jgi:hypothetical protein
LSVIDADRVVEVDENGDPFATNKGNKQTNKQYIYYIYHLYGCNYSTVQYDSQL